MADLAKKMGLKFKLSKKYKSHNGQLDLADIQIFPSKLTALEDKIEAHPYPSINIDNLPFFAVAAKSPIVFFVRSEISS